MGLLVNYDTGPAGKQYPSLTVDEKMNDLDTTKSGLGQNKRPLVRDKYTFLSGKYLSL